MKVKVPLLLLLMLATLAGYLLGTEAGKAQRDVLLEKLGRTRAEADIALDVAEAAIEEAEEAAAAADGEADASTDDADAASS